MCKTVDFARNLNITYFLKFLQIFEYINNKQSNAVLKSNTKLVVLKSYFPNLLQCF